MAQTNPAHPGLADRVFQRLFAAWGRQFWWPGETPLEIAVGAVLTQNTNWRNAARAIRNVRDAGAWDFAALCAASTEDLERWFRPAGTHRVKARRVRHLLDWLERECQGEWARLAERSLPDLRASLLGVHGIGPETADAILLYAVGLPVFVIDAYTRRVLSRHGWIAPDAGYAEAQAWFSRQLSHDAAQFNEYHALLVLLGKEHCRTRPKCDGCPLDSMWLVSPAVRPVQQET